MTALPDGWVEMPLEDVTTVVLGQSPPGSSYNVERLGTPFLQGKAEFGDITPEIRKWTTAPKKMAREGDVLLSVRAPVGPTNLAPCTLSIGRGLAALRAEDGLSNRYLLWAMRATATRLADKATGTTFPAVSGKVVRSHMIPVPPLPEQQRIVASIEEQFSRLDAAEASLALAVVRSRSLRQSVLREAFAGRLLGDAGKEFIG